MKTKVLLDAINSILPGTTTKGLIPGSNMIVIINGELTAYNDRISITTYIDDPGLSIECAVNAEDFRNVIKGIKEEEVDLSMGDNILSIVAEETEAELPVTSEITGILEMIKGLNTSGLEFNKLPANFNEGLSLIRFNVSDDYSSPHNLFCLFIDGATMISADNFRVSRYTLNESTKVKCLVPKNNLADLVTFEPIGITTTKGWVHFMNQTEAVFSCRTVVGDYPDVTSFFDVTGGTTITLPDKLKETLGDLSALYDEVLDSHKSLKVEIKDGTLLCEIEREKVWIKKKLAIDQKDVPNISFMISSVFLGEILLHTKKLLISGTKALFETKSFEHLVLLQVKE